jgi:hypothetical protein
MVRSRRARDDHSAWIGRIEAGTLLLLEEARRFGRLFPFGGTDVGAGTERRLGFRR